MLDGFFDLELARDLADDMDLGLARQLTAEVERRPGGATGQVAALDRSGLGPAPAGASAGTELRAPIVAPVSSAYGQRVDPLSGALGFHAGLDLAAPRGTPVRAAAAGAVVFSGTKGAAGNLVELRHRDGSRTSYAHLENLDVEAGDTVTAGQVLGAVGTSGRTTGPHLHFAVERAGAAVDPAPLIEKRIAG
jgi:murein DD-endopeptidase MepM/ murein hydrolase activator NlpD